LKYGDQSNKNQIDGTIYSGVIDKLHQEIHEGQVKDIGIILEGYEE